MPDETTPTTPPVTPPPPVVDPALMTKMDELMKQTKSQGEELEKMRKANARKPNLPAPTVGVDGKPLTREQQLEQFANDKARELELLRVAIENGLTEDELGDLDYSNPTELRLAARIKSMEKQQKALGETASEQKKALDALKARQTQEGPEDDEVDTGGRTRRAASDPAKQKKLYEDAQALGRTPKARYALLDAIRRDPTKVIRDMGSEEE